MKGLALCLGLLLTFSASASSLDVALCRTTSLPVARMESQEKLCRSFARALAALPATMTDDARVLLTPENLALMGTLTTAWLGSQGVPVVGEVVDAALLVLGVSLLAGQAEELVHFLWTYANLAMTARSTVELDTAATSLARALSLVGINVVAFILTKKAMAKAPRGPPSPPREFALPQGGVAAATAMEWASPSASDMVPAVLMAGGAGSGRKPPEQERRPAKKPDPAAFEKWIRQAERKPAIEMPEPAAGFQKRHAGAEEILVEGGGKQIWADGARASDAHLLETKYIEKPGTSPFIEGSACDADIRQIIRTKEVKEFTRYAAVILDPVTPAVGLEVIVNDARALPYFQALMRELGIPGRVVLKQ
ncbi:restriction endonuclease fold toxin-2 domain-containing protein [Vitiosangium sp. GDMCC 1.1324]|uniref:restriction endonuclease fold toxin-2 domain-containing protein n=1 Tax=Vitiosangium sp. (strain GDMCC 1.1324) TaxID=2138576 RepID=UPI000D3B8E0E|nr:restriction endonuclease fold toxin-2 domain-containing protein [Vitiosangium sp. GDMCC 1.1324]PTL81804.1 hypothetical protein DAT35_22975 [Vitiosangium sp. GDMCC 1.1324]